MQVFFMPWADMETCISIGPVTFWPYYKEAGNLISDSSITEWLNGYFELFVDHHGNPVKTITVCTHRDFDFRELSADEQQDIRNAVDGLIFSAIMPKVRGAVCSDNKSIVPPTSDVFNLFKRRFTLKDKGIIINTESRFEYYSDMKDIMIVLPWELGGFSWSADPRIVNGLDRLFSLHEKERIYRSLEWFRMAHIETGQFSILTKVVMMATAFEILLQLDEKRKREKFALYLDDTTALYEHKKEKQEGDRCSYYFSPPGCWAWNYYRLRSRIVHGDPIDHNQLIFNDWRTHLNVADLVFHELLLRELFELNCVGEDVRSCVKDFEETFSDGDEKMPTEPVLRAFFGFDDIHRALGWIDCS